jgi:hypothetical protein
MRGVLPNSSLLRSFNRLRIVYEPLIAAFKSGNLEGFDNELRRCEKRLLERGTYLVVLRAREGCLRTLCKKVCVVAALLSLVPPPPRLVRFGLNDRRFFSWSQVAR